MVRTQLGSWDAGSLPSPHPDAACAQHRAAAAGDMESRQGGLRRFSPESRIQVVSGELSEESWQQERKSLGLGALASWGRTAQAKGMAPP